MFFKSLVFLVLFKLIKYILLQVRSVQGPLNVPSELHSALTPHKSLPVPVLPELPLPSPLAPHGAGSSILPHPALEEQARKLLQGQDPALAARLAQALQACPPEYLQQGPGPTPAALSLPLPMAVQRHFPQVLC